MNCSYVAPVLGVTSYPMPTGVCATFHGASLMAECNGDSSTITIYRSSANCTGDGQPLGGATVHNCPNPSCDYFHGCSDGGNVHSVALDVCSVLGSYSIKYTSCSGETGSQSVEGTFYMDTKECSASATTAPTGDFDESCTVCSPPTDNGDNTEVTKSPTSGDNDEVTKAPSSSTSDAFDVKPKGLVILGLIAAVSVAVSML